MKISRKEFLRSIVGIGVGAAGIAALASCGGGGDDGGDDEPPPGGDCLMDGTTTSIGSNHGHTLTIPKADIELTTDKDYMMTGGGHSHPLTVTAAMFAMLRDNASVQGRSKAGDGTGHDHTFTVNCA